MRGGGYYSRGGGNTGQRGGSNTASAGTSGNTGNNGGNNNGYGGNTNHRGNHQGNDDRDNKEKKKRDAIFDLKKYTDKRICVKFMGGREVTGVLKGSDQLLNIVLDEAEETLRDPENSDSSEERKRHIGLVVLRGPSIILVSPTDGSEEIENPFVQAE
ncbi:U6 snRNP-associated protein Lsm7 [Kickxella alabastrina]|uniref:U6 snRNP-associated protein Lsm7 n=1 Tax=Kickxella alabastrina TaxID=61397 RepID=A0ACC1IHW5_9FUNG|nr:U6 snRNP-associated protein Lsm7 [Kickxella alabastrina]